MNDKQYDFLDFLSILNRKFEEQNAMLERILKAVEK